MKNILVTGGTDGIGKGIVLDNLKKGNTVLAVGTSKTKAENLLQEAKSLHLSGKLIFLQADLSLISENQRVMANARECFDQLDQLVLCAASLKPQKAFSETEDGFEFTFALYYLSRLILCYGLRELLEKADDPRIINVAAPGMSGTVNWGDLQMKEKYDGQKAQFHGSRLNDLLAVRFTNHFPKSRITYVLFNPMAARTNGAKQMAASQGAMKLMMALYYRFAGKDVEEIMDILNQDMERTAGKRLSAYKLNQEVDLHQKMFDQQNAERLYQETINMLSSEVQAWMKNQEGCSAS